MKHLVTLALCLALAAPAWAAKGAKPKAPEPKPAAPVAAAPPAPAAPALPKLLFFGVNANDTVSKEMSSIVEEMFQNSLAKTKSFAVVGRGEAAKALSAEKQKLLPRCEADAPCATELGGALPAEYVGSAAYGKQGGQKAVSFKLLVVKTGAVAERGERKVGDEEQLPGAVDELVKEALGAIRQAQAAQPKAVALDHAAKAQTLFTEGAFADSVAEWEAAIADAAAPKAELFLNLAQAARLADDAPKALENYRKFLQLQPNPPNFEEVSHFVAELESPKRPDHVGPHIEHTPPPAAPPGATFSLVARMTDPSGVFQPFLHWRLGATGRYNAIALQPLGDDRFAAAIPAQQVGEIHYFLEGFDAKGNGPVRHGTPSFPHVLPIKPDAAPIPKVEVPPPALAKSALPEQATKAAVTASHGRGPIAYAVLGAALVAAGAGGFFGYQSSSSAAKWKGANDYDIWVSARQGAYDAASRANTSYLVAGALGAAGAGLYLFTEF